MSTVKAVNFQVGQSLTASQNFSWYQPSSPDGTVRLGVGNAGATTSDVLVANSSGNVGIGTSSPSNIFDVSKTQNSETSIGLTNTSSGVDAQVRSKYTTNSGLFTVGTTGTAHPYAGDAYLWQVANKAIRFGTNDTERMRLDSSGNLGLGVTPSGWSLIKSFQIAGGVSLGGYNNNLYLNANAYYDGSWKYVANGYATRIQSDTGSFSWFTAPSGTAGNAISFTQAMTLDANGNLLVGTTASPAGSARFRAGNGAGIEWSFGPNTGSSFLVYNPSSVGVYISTGNTSWTATSDERLKTDLKPIENAAEKVTSLRAVTGRFKTDDEGVSRSFLIAQDVLAVLPEAVDSTDPDRLGVQYTEVIPLLVAAIKELSAQVTTLQAEINALKA